MRAIEIEMPDWLAGFVALREVRQPDVETRMRTAVDLAQANAEQGGGPFGAAVFDMSDWRLLAVGVNLVVPAHCSSAHAEIVALSAAQRAVGSHDLGAGGRSCELVSSTEPCAMCLGAIPWSGVCRLVCGARDADARAVGFDEGAKPPDWPAELERRGITVVRDILRDTATHVLREYKARGGEIYNPSPRLRTHPRHNTPTA